MPTIFERIIARELPATIHYEDDDCIVIDDAFPQAPVHILLITKKVIPSIQEITAEDTALVAKLMGLIPQMAKKLGVENSYRVVTNVGEDAGQTVSHLHVHVIGGKKLGPKGG